MSSYLDSWRPATLWDATMVPEALRLLAAAKEEVGKPFLYEEELRSKNARLVELDTLLNIDGKGQAHAEAVVAKSTRTSVLDSLKRPAMPRSTDKKPKRHEEVR